MEPYVNDEKATLPCLHPICLACAAKKDEGDCLFLRENSYCGQKYKKHEVVVGQLNVAIMHPCHHHSVVGASMYCKQCNQTACLECFKTTHDGHCMQTLENGLATREQLIQAKLASLEKKCNGLKLGGNSDVKVDLDWLTAHLATTANNIDETFDAMILSSLEFARLASARKEQLRREAQETISADIKTLEQQMDTQAIFKQDVDSVKGASSSSPNNATLALISARLVALDNSHVDTTPAVKETTYFFNLQAVQVATLFEALKDIQVGQLGQLGKGALRAPPKIGRDYKKIGAPVKIIGKEGAGQGELLYPIGLAVDAAGNLVVGDRGNQRVQFFNKKGGHVRFINCGVAVWGVSVAPSGEVWVANGGSELCLYNPQSGALVRSIAAKPMYCASLPDGSVVVSTGSPHVRLYNPAGVQQWESTGSGLANTYGVCHVPDINAVAVCDYNNKRVQLMSLADGRHIRTIGEGQFSSYVFSIAYDAAAKVLVVGEDDKVSAWTLEGQPVHQWGQGTVLTAYGVAIDPSDSTIYVSDSNNNWILVY